MSDRYQVKPAKAPDRFQVWDTLKGKSLSSEGNDMRREQAEHLAEWMNRREKSTEGNEARDSAPRLDAVQREIARRVAVADVPGEVRDVAPEMCPFLFPRDGGQTACGMERGHLGPHGDRKVGEVRDVAPEMCPFLFPRDGGQTACGMERGHLGPHGDRKPGEVRDVAPAVGVVNSRPGTRATAAAAAPASGRVRDPHGKTGNAYPEISSFDSWRRVFRRLGEDLRVKAALARTKDDTRLARNMSLHAMQTIRRDLPSVHSQLGLDSDDLRRRRIRVYFRCVADGRPDDRLRLELDVQRGVGRTIDSSRPLVTIASTTISRAFCEMVRAVHAKLEEHREEGGGASLLAAALSNYNGLLSENEAESDATLYRLNRVVAEVQR